MKFFKFNYILKFAILGFFAVTLFTGCQVDEPILETDQLQEEISKNAGFLRVHEACGGHTIERHIAKSDQYLRDRLRRYNISAASSFYELNQAGQVIVNAINRNSSRVNSWLNGSGGSRLVLNYTHHRNIGKVLRRNASYPVQSNRFLVVLERRNCSNYRFRVLTAYPVN